MLLLALVSCQGATTWDDWNGRRDAYTSIPAAHRLAAHDAVLTQLPAVPGTAVGDGAVVAERFDLEMRHPGFPETYVSDVYVDLTSPHHHAWVEWTGPGAEAGPRGPWSSVSGTGRPGLDCNDPAVSNTTDTYCTPKGHFAVAGFADQLLGTPSCHYVTWVHFPRAIALHSHWELPDHPASHGCVRLPREAAKLIHNNSRAGLTHVHIDGTWTAPTEQLDDSLDD